MNKVIFSGMFFLGVFASHAQEQVSASPQMADRFREEGKIYVVITVLSIVFLAIVGFLVYLERKVKKLEQALEKEQALKNNNNI